MDGDDGSEAPSLGQCFPWWGVLSQSPLLGPLSQANKIALWRSPCGSYKCQKGVLFTGSKEASIALFREVKKIK